MSDKTKSLMIKLGVAVAILLVAFIIFVNTPAGKAWVNNYNYKMTKVDDSTNYEKLKVVEDTCRAMISTYEADKITYESYKDDKDEDMRDVAVQAKIRANTTATKYNEYVLKNEYMWADNIPSDIKEELPVLE